MLERLADPRMPVTGGGFVLWHNGMRRFQRLGLPTACRSSARRLSPPTGRRRGRRLAARPAAEINERWGAGGRDNPDEPPVGCSARSTTASCGSAVECIGHREGRATGRGSAARRGGGVRRCGDWRGRPRFHDPPAAAGGIASAFSLVRAGLGHHLASNRAHRCRCVQGARRSRPALLHHSRRPRGAVLGGCNAGRRGGRRGGAAAGGAELKGAAAGSLRRLGRAGGAADRGRRGSHPAPRDRRSRPHQALGARCGHAAR